MIISIIIMGLLFLIPSLAIRMTAWSVLIMIGLVFMMIPFAQGNKEMKSLKKEIGLISKGITYTDFTNVDSVHALKISSVIIPNIIAAVLCLIALMYDLGAFNIAGRASSGSFSVTTICGSFLIVGIMIIPIAIMFDRFRNEVISDDSDINRNYNRTRKKTWADFSTLLAWANTVVILIGFPILIFWESETTMLVIALIYMLMIVAGLFKLVKMNVAIDKIYRKETTIDIDDDDVWILGSLYYNPDDKRLNVEKRAGIGGTINLAHPVGKLIGILSVLLIIGCIATMIWLGIISEKPIMVSVNDGKLICHHMKDDYVIPIESIQDVVLGENFRDLKYSVKSGYNLDPVYKGKCTVEEKSNCRLFINADAGHYISFTADGLTYYISGMTSEETDNVYKQITE